MVTYLHVGFFSSSVQKVKGESEREELQLHKVVVHLEGEEENGPALEKPGKSVNDHLFHLLDVKIEVEYCRD